MYYNIAAGSFLSKKLCSRLLSIEVEFYSKQVAQLSQRDRAMHELLRFAKLRSGIFEPPFGGLRGKVGALSIPRWKAPDRLPIYK